MTHLIPFAPEHFDILCSWFSGESDVVQWGGTALSFPLLAADMEEMLRETRSDPPGRFCFMAQAGGCCVGHVQLVLDWRNGTARIARVAVAPDARGRGIAAEMLGQAMAKAFALPGFERLELVATASTQRRSGSMSASASSGRACCAPRFASATNGGIRC